MPRVAGLLIAMLILSGCDTLDFGYVNKLDRPITIVEHSGNAPQPMHLKPGAVSAPGFGAIPHTIDVLQLDGHLLASYHTRDLPRSGPRGGVAYVVISKSGAVIERRDHFSYDRWDLTMRWS